MIGIYKITNKINNKCYIGQSTRIERRWEEHLYQTDRSSLIKYALRKYGINNFLFEVVEECKQEELNEREQYWIQFYNSYEEGYNLTLGGGGAIKYSIEMVYEDYCKTNNMAQTAKNIGCSVSTVRRVLREYGINNFEAQRAKPVQSIDPHTLKVIKIYSSIEEAANEYNVVHNTIKFAADGRNKTACGLYWQYVGEKREFIKDPQIKRNNIKVAKLDYNTCEVIEIFNSLADAAESCGKDRKNGSSMISSVCKNKKNSAYGYKWKYIE